MRLSEKAWRTITRTAMLLMSIAVILAASGWAERERNADEEYLVYSAYLSDGLLNDAHDGSVGAPVLVVVEDQTRTTQNYDFRRSTLWMAVFTLMVYEHQPEPATLSAICSAPEYYRSLCCRAVPKWRSLHNQITGHPSFKRNFPTI
jgi:hypothetical protein